MQKYPWCITALCVKIIHQKKKQNKKLRTLYVASSSSRIWMRQTYLLLHLPTHHQNIFWGNNFQANSDYQVIRGSHTEVIVSGVHCLNKWNKCIIKNISKGSGRRDTQILWKLPLIRIWMKLKKVSDRMGKIEELTVFMARWTEKVLTQFLNTENIRMNSYLVQLFCILLIQDTQLSLYITLKNLEEYKETENTF